MKTKFNLIKSFGSQVCFKALAAGALLLGGFGGRSEAATPVSPVGTWDCVLSGSRLGLAYITFNGDGSVGSTFDILEFIVPKTPVSSSPGNGRGGDEGRGGSSGGTTTPPFLGTNVFGAFLTNGLWNFDLHGHLLGFFAEVIDGDCVTNTTVTSSTITNIDGSITTTSSTNDTIVCSGTTNRLSFTGTVVAGKRLTLVATSLEGRTIYGGLPAITLPDVSGLWYGIKTAQRLKSNESLLLAPSGDAPGVPNLYDVAGAGAASSYHGHVMISRHNRFGMVVGIDPDFKIVRSIVGTFNPRKGIANTLGFEQADVPLSVTNRVTFLGVRQAAPAE